jgi:DNA polymerase-1
MLAHFLADPEMRHRLDYLAEVFLGYSSLPIARLIGEKGEGQRSMRDVPLDLLTDYAAEDADLALQLKEALIPLLKERNGERVCREVEFPLIPVLVDMEYEGIGVDSGALREYSVQLSAETAELERRIFQAAGREFNLNSPRQLGEVFFDVLKLDADAKKTKTGQYATDEQVLTRLANRHPVARDVLDYRMLTKLKNTYVDTLPEAVHKETGRVHTTYNQTWTATGRMQSHDPNLQNIPIRRERGQEIRKAFVPRSREFALLSADYSQIELRIIAELSQDKAMLDAFVQNQDVHAATASKVFGVPLDQVTREMRGKAKMVNFGIIYGMSAFGLSQRLGIPRYEARDIIDQYFRQYPGVKRYIDQTIEFARQNGYVQTITGRRRYLRDINSRNASVRGQAERNAINSPIQGSAADMIKLAMVKIAQALRSGGYRTKMLLQVHDELLFDLYREEEADVLPLIESAMKTALPMKVPIGVEMGIGDNWLEAH